VWQPENWWRRLNPALFFAWGFCFAAQGGQIDVTYQLDPAKSFSRFDADQIALLEKLNRTDAAHLARLKHLIVPNRWDLDQLAYSPMPQTVPGLSSQPKALVVDLSAQVFGAYESGNLVRWGPVSSGDSRHQTPPGLYYLNWKARIRISSENDSWVMPWYFNISTKRGFGFHQYTLPGKPASHGCVRLLVPDAKWVFHWGEEWVLTSDRQIQLHGTPVLIVNSYDFTGTRPWLQPERWSRGVKLPVPEIAGLR
jgi:hypothetical protein